MITKKPFTKKKVLLCVVGTVFLFFGSLYIWLNDKYVVPILAYHHIDYATKGSPLALNTVSPHSFEKQMRYLRQHDYTVLRLYELIELIKSGKPLPRKTVVITFDDGYENNYTYAFGILKKYEFPASIFLVSDLVGMEGYLNLNQIREMMGHGIFFGSHTRTHPYLPEISYERQRDEIIESRKILQQKLNSPINFFVYPVGGFNEQVKNIVKEAGYLGACTTNRGHDRLNKDVYELKRIRMKNSDTKPYLLWAKFSGYYNVLRSTKNSE